MSQIKMAQYGTKHGHAAGKWVAMRENPDVDLVGVYEPDTAQRQRLADADGPFQNAHWYESEAEMLDDKRIIAIASEGANHESLDQTEAIILAGKHVWYDKPAGENLSQWQQIIALAEEKNLLTQMGYMFRYHHGFRQVAEWAKSGMLGHVFSIRAHMSTSISLAQRQRVSQHQGGIFFDLAGHVLDQIIWILGHPTNVTSFFHNDDVVRDGFSDNTVAVFEFEQAMAIVDIAAMEPKPMARRYEVYGTGGSAIIIEPFEPAETIRLVLTEARNGYKAGEQIVQVPYQSRQDQYNLALTAFVAAIQGDQPPDRSYAHELLVQESLLKATGVAR